MTTDEFQKSEEAMSGSNTNAPQLLNDDGTASMATALLMSHHAFRRDLARFGAALGSLAGGDASRASALAEEWRSYRASLHGHHEAEDQGIFPGLKAQRAELVPVLERLSADHRRIDPLLEEGDRAFAELGDGARARAAVAALSALLHEHLAFEEQHVIRFLRDAKQFPPPPSDAEADLYAQGFAWASDGVAAEVLVRLDEMLPPGLAARLPAARARFAERRARVWGAVPAGASRTSVPDWLTTR